MMNSLKLSLHYKVIIGLGNKIESKISQTCEALTQTTECLII